MGTGFGDKMGCSIFEEERKEGELKMLQGKMVLNADGVWAGLGFRLSHFEKE